MKEQTNKGQTNKGQTNKGQANIRQMKKSQTKKSQTNKKQNTSQNNGKTRYLFLIPVIIWMVFIFYMSSRTGNESTEQSSIISTFLTNVLEKVRQDGPQETERLNAVLETVIRKAAHMAEYAILFLLSYLAMVKISKSENRIYNKLTAALISLLYACTDEMHQLLVPGRSGKMTDVAIDMIGVILVLLCMKLAENPKWRIIAGSVSGIVVVAAFAYLMLGPF